jgi:hypothetical protein
VTEIDVPDESLGENVQTPAVPVLLKSPEAMPLTDSLNVNVYESVRDDDGELGSVHVAVGFTVSIVTLVAVAADDGPEFVAVSETAPDASLATTVPSEVQTTVTVIEVPESVLGVKSQPVAVPVLLKSSEAMPLTVSLKANVYESVRELVGELGAVHVAVGALVSMTSALFAPSDPLAPGDASVSVALLPAASLMVTPAETARALVVV